MGADSRGPLSSLGNSLPSRAYRFQAAIRVLLWLALLVAALMGLWAVLAAHRQRARGIPQGFPAPVREANVPALGVNVALDRYRDQEVASALACVADGGFVWVRQSFTWSQVKEDATAGGFQWSRVDGLMRALEDYPQLRLVAVLEDNPPAPPRDPDQFAAFAGAFAQRYGDQVDHYQIWDEPNLAANWGGGPVNPSAYADLLARAARAIRAADPEASILLAGLAPTTETGPQNLSDVRYLERLYQTGAGAIFDVVAAKAYGFDTGPEDRRVDPSLLNVSRLLLLREVMVKHGDGGKAIWASHWGWNALPQGWSGAPSIWGQTDEHTQAVRSVAMMERARDEWPWMGALIIETLRPDRFPSTGSASDLEDPRWGFALVAPDGTPRPVYEALADWAHTLPNAAPVGGYTARSRWATYGQGWCAGPLAADVVHLSPLTDHGLSSASPIGEPARFRFDGTRVAVTVRRGPYKAFLYVTVDEEPANALPRDEQGRAYVVLYDDRTTLDTVTLATGLTPGAHIVEVVAAGGHGQWPLVDWRVGAAPAPNSPSWKLAVLGAAVPFLAALTVRDLRRVRGASLGRAFLRLPAAVQMASMVGLTGALWATAAQSWGRLTPHALPTVFAFTLSLLTLPPLAFLFSLRLDVGLALIAATAPFYLVPEGMVYRALSLPEVLVLLALVSYAAPRIAPSRLVRWPPDLQDDAVTSPHDSDVVFSNMDAAVALLILAALVAGAAAADRLAALFELRSVFLLPALYYALLRLVSLGREEQRRIVDGFLLGGTAVALIGLGQVVLGRNLVAAEGGALRLQSVYHSPNSVGLYLGRVWPFLAAGALWGAGGRRRGLVTLALTLVTAAVVLSLSRGALLLALPAAVLALGWRAGGRYRWVAVVLIAMGGLVLIPLLRLPRFAGLLDLGQGTTFFRLKLWRSSLRMVWEHPMLGVGPGNFREAYQSRYVLPTAWEEFNLEHAHNLLLDHWTRLGVLGVLAGLTAQVSFWGALQRQGDGGVRELSLVGGMAAVLAHGLVDNAFFFPDLALSFFLMLALAQEGERARAVDE